MVEVYVTLILKGKKTLDEVPSVIRNQVEQMLKDLEIRLVFSEKKLLLSCKKMYYNDDKYILGVNLL